MLDCGKVDGVLYGIPYQAQMQYAVYSRKLTGERDSWTLREMMDAVRSSNAEILSYGVSGADIVFYYGLTDNDNKELIDWEKGESHLTGELFLELLEFAAEYGDKGNLEAGEVGKAIEEGRVASEMVYMSQLESINSMEACFGGEPSFIGFPRTEGSGIYAIPRMLYLNSGSKVKEGAEEFLGFLVSEENQMHYVEQAAGNGQSFTVREKSLDRQIELKKREEARADEQAHSWYGYPYDWKGFTDQQEEWFRFAVANARPSDWKALDILSIVNEELEPYFAGQWDAKETAEILDNRVQLFLDERTRK